MRGILVAAVLLAGCAGGTMPTTAPDTTAPDVTLSTTTAPPTTTVSPSVPEVPEVLDFTATLSDGSSFAGADLAGTDVLFWFWAPN